MQREEDNLFEVKTYFYIGAYQQVLNETINSKSGKVIYAQSRRFTRNLIIFTNLFVFIEIFQPRSIEQDCYMWRAYIAQNKYRVVLDGIDANDQTVLLSIRKVAEYFAYPDKRNAIMEYFDGKLNEDFDDEHKPMWCLSAATIYHNEGIYENGLRVLNGQSDLECIAMSIQCLLKMNRLDLAKKLLVRMQEKDDDATLTQLATAWININIGGEKLQDAYFIFQDFCDKFVTTSLLLNGQAVCHIGQEKFEEAESALRESLDKDSNNYNTLINLIALTQHTEKNSDVIYF